MSNRMQFVDALAHTNTHAVNAAAVRALCVHAHARELIAMDKFTLRAAAAYGSSNIRVEPGCAATWQL